MTQDIREKQVPGQPSFRSRIMRGGTIIGIGSGAEQGLRFVRNMLITRLLLPDQVGVMAIILAINMALESFTDVGIREAIIQHPRSHEKTYLNGAFWFSIIRSLILAGIGILLATWLCGFYHIAHHENLMRLSFLAIVFNGAISPRAAIALKDMKYGPWVAIMQGGAFLGITATLILVFQLRSAQALIIGYVSEAFFKAVLSYVLCPFSPGFKTTPEHRKALFTFAGGMAGVPLLNFLFLQADLFVLGKLVPTATIGLYGMAGSLAGIPVLLISVFINPIMTPVFSSIRSDTNRVNDALIKATTLLATLGFPLCIGAALCGKEIMALTYGASYSAAGLAFSILFIGSFIRTIAAPIPTIYIGLGRPGLNRRFAFVRTLLCIAAIYPAARFGGTAGAAMAGAGAMAVSWFFQLGTLHALTGLPIQRYRNALLGGLPGIAITLACGTIVLFTAGPIIRIGIVATGCALGILASAGKIRSIIAPKAPSQTNGASA